MKMDDDVFLERPLDRSDVFSSMPGVGAPFHAAAAACRTPLSARLGMLAAAFWLACPLHHLCRSCCM